MDDQADEINYAKQFFCHFNVINVHDRRHILQGKDGKTIT